MATPDPITVEPDRHGGFVMSLVDEGPDMLSDDECRGLLGSASVGRIGVSVNALPVIAPVNYRLVGEVIQFWSGPALKLNATQARTVVAFEVDDLDPQTKRGWSVLAVGLAAEVHDLGVLDAAARDSFGPWVEGERSHLIEVKIEFLSGRRIVSTPTSAGNRRERVVAVTQPGSPSQN